MSKNDRIWQLTCFLITQLLLLRLSMLFPSPVSGCWCITVRVVLLFFLCFNKVQKGWLRVGVCFLLCRLLLPRLLPELSSLTHTSSRVPASPIWYVKPLIQAIDNRKRKVLGCFNVVSMCVFALDSRTALRWHCSVTERLWRRTPAVFVLSIRAHSSTGGWKTRRPRCRLFAYCTRWVT